MRVRFIYKHQPRQFSYRPRYYDPEKEAREKRRQELVGARPSDGEYVPGSIIRSKTTARLEDMETRRKGQRGKTMKLALILALLFAVVIWLFFS